MSQTSSRPPAFGMTRTLTLRIYYVASFAVGGIYVPYFPRWLEARGIYGARLGIIFAASPAMGLVAPTAFGILADALGLRTGLLQVACAGGFVSFGALTVGVAMGLPLTFPLLLSAAVAIAVFRAPMSMMADVVAVEWAVAHGTTYGRLRLWGSLGFLSAAVFGGLFVNPRDAVRLPLLATGCLFAGLLASLCLPRRTGTPWRRFRDGSGGSSQSQESQSEPPNRSAASAAPGIAEILAETDFRIFLVAIFLSQCAQAAYDMYFSIHLGDLGVSRTFIGLAWALGTGAEVVLMAWSSGLFRAFSPPAVLAIGLGSAAVRWVMLATVHSGVLVLFLQPLHALSFGLVWVAAVTYTSRRFPSRSLARAQGLFTTATGAGSVVGMLTWGPVYQRGGGSLVFAGAACFAVCASVFAVALARRVRA